IRFAAEDLRKIGRALRVLDKKRDEAVFSRARSFYEGTLARLAKLAANPEPSVRLAVAVACRQLVSSSLTVDTEVEPEASVGDIPVPSRPPATEYRKLSGRSNSADKRWPSSDRDRTGRCERRYSWSYAHRIVSRWR